MRYTRNYFLGQIVMSQLHSDSTSKVVRQRMEYIDGLRGIACLWVLLHHSLEHHPVAAGLSHLPLRVLVELANLGWLGVSLFLVLSGFCLYYPLVRRAEISSVQLDLKTFAKRRALRILPPYYAALAINVSLILFYHYRHHMPLFQDFYGWMDIPAHILMLHNLNPSTFGSINGVFWSLALESQLYLVFPFFVILSAQRGLKTTLKLTLLISVVWQSMVFFKLGFSQRWDPNLATWYHALPARAFEFTLGMAAAAWVAYPAKRSARQCAGVMLILLPPCVWYASQISRFGPLLDQMWGVTFFCAIIALNKSSDFFQKNVVARFFVWTGTISYSLYLTHTIVFSFIAGSQKTDGAIVVWAILKSVVAIVVAYLFFLLFERPFINRRKASSNLVEATFLSPAP